MNHSPDRSLPLWKAQLYFFITVAVLSLTACSTSNNTGKYKGGWYSVKYLKKQGFSVPDTKRKSIYLRPTADTSKVNIKPE